MSVKPNKSTFKFRFVNGRLSHYEGEWWDQKSKVEEKTAQEARFTGELTYTGYSRGRSSAQLHFVDKDGKGYNFFMSTFDEIVRHLVNGKLTGVFEPVKKGSNCAWRLVPTEEH